MLAPSFVCLFASVTLVQSGLVLMRGRRATESTFKKAMSTAWTPWTTYGMILHRSQQGLFIRDDTGRLFGSPPLLRQYPFGWRDQAPKLGATAALRQQEHRSKRALITGRGRVMFLPDPISLGGEQGRSLTAPACEPRAVVEARSQQHRTAWRGEVTVLWWVAFRWKIESYCYSSSG
jgi:hypothetical protein